ncbi:MAG: hypothetical protein WCL00_07745, partial [Bacteroidota bacterium]
MINLSNKSHYLLLLLIFARATLFAQTGFYDPPCGKLFDTDNNYLDYAGEAEKSFSRFYTKLDTLAVTGKGHLNILQIGDSHIQAGFLPQKMREGFSNTFSGGVGERGLIFPYRMSKSNNPPDYVVTWSGKWDHCRNVETKKSCELGLTGFYVRTSDSISSFTIRFREDIKNFDYNKLNFFTLASTKIPFFI